jgi:hypothetical protein
MRCSVIVSGPSFHESATGTASGYGYHKASAAAEDAVRRLGWSPWQPPGVDTGRTDPRTRYRSRTLADDLPPDWNDRVRSVPVREATVRALASLPDDAYDPTKHDPDSWDARWKAYGPGGVGEAAANAMLLALALAVLETDDPSHMIPIGSCP